MFVPWELNPQPFALLTQCSTTEPQEHRLMSIMGGGDEWILEDAETSLLFGSIPVCSGELCA